MTQTRRSFLTSVAAAGTITVLPFKGRAAGHASNMFESDAGTFTVHPVSHASVVIETPAGVMYIDPVGEVSQYSDLPAADMILITHEHGDHYNADTLDALKGEDTVMLTNPAVFDMLPEGMKTNTTSLANGESTEVAGVEISAIPAYNTTEGRTDFHPEGRDNGYVLDFDGFRIYVSGDTEDIPEMRALEDIDLAFVCMNLPFTMSADAAASAVSEFAPTYVYPYHYRGRDNGTQDPAEFAEMVEGDVEVKMGEWYS
ncbi:MBL fold metallo-hydrolase [Marivita sp.]|uniref:MBL fold metallo-hydrolase n=1 Tax=Marivita sp. TaxID=2003365 RepID=UPI0025C474C8|nr:MBL fold metallo-hydrolase [Marivita sp.]